MRQVFFVFIVFILVMIAGCATKEAPMKAPPAKNVDLIPIDSCNADTDCICGGVDIKTGRCFLGNKGYYERNVDISKQCPDFCNGIAGNLVVRCIDNKCIQMLECIEDSDCSTGKCSRNRCV